MGDLGTKVSRMSVPYNDFLDGCGPHCSDDVASIISHKVQIPKSGKPLGTPLETRHNRIWENGVNERSSMSFKGESFFADSRGLGSVGLENSYGECPDPTYDVTTYQNGQ